MPDCGRGEDELPAHCIALGPAADLGQNPLLVPDTAEAGYVKVGHWDTWPQRADTCLQVRTYGTWYTYCAPAWTGDEAATICEALGFTQLTNWTAEHSPEVILLYLFIIIYGFNITA